jgi:hypothetical protein
MIKLQNKDNNFYKEKNKESLNFKALLLKMVFLYQRIFNKIIHNLQLKKVNLME